MNGLPAENQTTDRPTSAGPVSAVSANLATSPPPFSVAATGVRPGGDDRPGVFRHLVVAHAPSRRQPGENAEPALGVARGVRPGWRIFRRTGIPGWADDMQGPLGAGSWKRSLLALAGHGGRGRDSPSLSWAGGGVRAPRSKRAVAPARGRDPALG